MPHYPQEEIKPYNESESKAVQVKKCSTTLLLLTTT